MKEELTATELAHLSNALLDKIDFLEKMAKSPSPLPLQEHYLSFQKTLIELKEKVTRIKNHELFKEKLLGKKKKGK